MYIFLQFFVENKRMKNKQINNLWTCSEFFLDLQLFCLQFCICTTARPVNDYILDIVFCNSILGDVYWRTWSTKKNMTCTILWCMIGVSFVGTCWVGEMNRYKIQMYLYTIKYMYIWRKITLWCAGCSSSSSQMEFSIS